MANSTTQKYISANLQTNECADEIHLVNPSNKISGQIFSINPKTQKMENISNIFFNKQDGQQIAETIKDQVKESVKTEVVAEIEDEIKQDIKQELQGEYLTVESASSMFISKDKEETFALKDDVRTNIQLAMQNVEDTYLTLAAAEEDYATKNGMQTAIDDVKTFVSQTYLKAEDASDFITSSQAEEFALKSEIQNVEQSIDYIQQNYLKKEDVQDIVKKADFSQIAKIDTESEYTLVDVVAKVNEILDILKGSNEGGDEGEDEGDDDDDDPSVNSDPAKTRVIYTEESGLPRTDIDIVGDLKENSIPNRDQIKEVYIGNTVARILTGAFDWCSGLTSVTIGNGVTIIFEDAFRNCHALANVTIPEGVTNIGQYVFDSCTALNSITTPSSVTSIGQFAFSRTNISTVTILGRPVIDSSILEYNSHISTLNMPEFTIDEVQNSASYWGIQSGCVVNCKDGTFTL